MPASNCDTYARMKKCFYFLRQLETNVCEAFKAPVITWITGDKHTILLLGGILMLDEILFWLLCILR